MLVLTVQPVVGKDTIFIDNDIVITILEVDRRSGQVKLGFNAPGRQVERAQLRERKKLDNIGNC